MSKVRAVFTFYGDKGFVKMWDAFQKKCKSENSSASSAIRVFIKSVLDNEIGIEPQQTLLVYADTLDKKRDVTIDQVVELMVSTKHDRGIEVHRRDILDAFKDIESGSIRVDYAREVLRRLKLLEIPVTLN